MLDAFGSPSNLDKRRLQLAKTTGVVQAAGDGVVQAAHRRSCRFCVCGVWLALALVHIVRDGKRYILRPPQILRMRGRVRVRVHGTGGVLARASRRLSERLHCRWPKQGAAVAKQGVLAS